MHYRTHGMFLDSDLCLPELEPVSFEPATLDRPVRICTGVIAPEALSGLARLGPYLWAGPGRLFLQVVGAAAFLVSEGRHILVEPSGSAMEIVRHQLLSSILAALLYQRGQMVLHGCAIRISDRCLVCVGPSGIGKSTLAAAFQRRGFDVLADDMVPIDASGNAIPGRSQILLCPDAAQRLRLGDLPARQVGQGAVKHVYSARRHRDDAIPVGWVHLLQTGPDPEIICENIQDSDRFRVLRQNSFRPRFMQGMDLSAQHLMLCSQLAARARMLRVTRPAHGFGVDSIIDRLLADVELNG